LWSNNTFRSEMTPSLSETKPTILKSSGTKTGCIFVHPPPGKWPRPRWLVRAMGQLRGKGPRWQFRAMQKRKEANFPYDVDQRKSGGRDSMSGLGAIFRGKDGSFGPGKSDGGPRRLEGRLPLEEGYNSKIREAWYTPLQGGGVNVQNLDGRILVA